MQQFPLKVVCTKTSARPSAILSLTTAHQTYIAVECLRVVASHADRTMHVG